MINKRAYEAGVTKPRRAACGIGVRRAVRGVRRAACGVEKRYLVILESSDMNVLGKLLGQPGDLMEFFVPM